MICPPRFRPVAAACFAAFAFIGSADAWAQAPPLSESIVIGAWTFRPSLEARLRGDYRRDAFQLDRRSIYVAKGAAASSDAVLGDQYNSNLPPAVANRACDPGVDCAGDVWSMSERIRLGLAVDRGPVTAVLKLQDSRLLGGSPYATLNELQLAPPGAGIAPYEAYIDVHARTGRPMFLRIGRQAVQWGDGRLIGTNDFTLTGRSLDAARFGVELGDFDIEAMAAILGYPYFGLTSSEDAAATTGNAGTSGAQLYGLKITGHFLPLLHVEVIGLARLVRPPTGPFLWPSDTFVIDGRIFGDYRGFHYSLEAAYELGQVASYKDPKAAAGSGVRSLQAPAFAGRIEWETALPWHLTFGAQGAYASGDNGAAESTPDKPMTRFDPILPDETTNHSKMSLYTWSNLIEAGGDLTARPAEEVSLTAGYRFVGLANPKGRWITGALATVGSGSCAADAAAGCKENDSNILGHEIDAVIRVTPWDPITFQAGYGLFLLGDGGKTILANSGRSVDMQHFGYLQAVVKAP